MVRRRHLSSAYDKQYRLYDKPYQPSEIKKESSSDENEQQYIGEFPLVVGKAVKDDKKLKQPKAAEAGIVPKVAFRWMFSGPSNSGKTNLARWTLDKMYQVGPGKSFFDKIYLFSPTAKLDPVWKDLDGLRPGDRITDLEKGGKQKLLEIFENGIRRTKAIGKDKAPHTLVIIDDSIADVKFLNSRDFLRIFIAGRHGNVSVMVMTQSYNKIPRTCRMQLTAVSMFPSKVSEIERLWDEHGPVDMGKWEFVDMVKYAIKKTETEKYPFFFVDADKPEDERFRRCFYEILRPVQSTSPDASVGIHQDAYSRQGVDEGVADDVPHLPRAKRPRNNPVEGEEESNRHPEKRRRR